MIISRFYKSNNRKADNNVIVYSNIVIKKIHVVSLLLMIVYNKRPIHLYCSDHAVRLIAKFVFVFSLKSFDMSTI